MKGEPVASPLPSLEDALHESINQAFDVLVVSLLFRPVFAISHIWASLSIPLLLYACVYDAKSVNRNDILH